jgi:hypothetical protein
MEQIFEFKRSRVLLSFLILIFFSICSIWLILEPEIFIRNRWMKKVHIQFLGTISFLFNLLYLFSRLLILPRKKAVVVTSDFLIDNSRYESLGVIYWTEISKILKSDKNLIKIYFKDLNLKNRKLSIYKRILLYMTNWNYETSIIISNAQLNCSIDELEKSILSAFKNHKKLVK